MHLNSISKQELKIQDFQILSFGRDLIDTLKKYLDLEKQFLPRRFYHIMRFIKPIDFHELEQKSEMLLEELIKTHKSIDGIIPTQTNEIVKQYSKLLLEYSDSLYETIGALQIIFRKLYYKGLSWSHFWKYSWKEYTEDWDIYCDSIKKYSNIGDNINLFRDEIMGKQEMLRIASSKETMTFLNNCLFEAHIQDYKMQFNDIQNVFLKLLFCGVTDEKTRSIIETPSLLKKYFNLKHESVSDYLIAGYFMCEN